MKYKRILIKLSGEAIGAESGRGISKDSLEKVVDQLVEISNSGVELAVVIGAGNFWRGKYGEGYVKKTTSDYMGMLATTINSLALQDMLESKNVHTRVMSSIEMNRVAEPYILRKAQKHLSKGRIVIFACGTGNPYFTTDTAASLRATEIGADAILLAKNVDGVYDKDPNKFEDAKKYEKITYMDAISQKLEVMDTTALTLCMENKIPIIVFGLNEKQSIKRVIDGDKIGTIVED